MKREPFDAVEFIYNSSKIEGVELDPEKIRKKLLGQDVRLELVEGIHINNQLNALNKGALAFPVSIGQLHYIHFLVSDGLLTFPGFMRKVDVSVGDHIPPKWQTLEREVDKLCQMINNKVDPWKCHMEFERIHPYVDFNGRTGRAMLYHHERLLSITPTIVTFDNREEYYQELDNYDKSIYNK